MLKIDCLGQGNFFSVLHLLHKEEKGGGGMDFKATHFW